MTVHFICRGNAFRSRMAESYFNSLELPGWSAISSGSVADLHSQSNKNNFLITQSILVEHGLKKFTKTHWNQLTQDRIDICDITICLSPSVKDECDQLFKMPSDTFVWNIADFDEVVPIPVSTEEVHQYAEHTFQLLVEATQRFMRARE